MIFEFRFNWLSNPHYFDAPVAQKSKTKIDQVNKRFQLIPCAARTPDGCKPNELLNCNKFSCSNEERNALSIDIIDALEAFGMPFMLERMNQTALLAIFLFRCGISFIFYFVVWFFAAVREIENAVLCAVQSKR